MDYYSFFSDIIQLFFYSSSNRKGSFLEKIGRIFQVDRVYWVKIAQKDEKVEIYKEDEWKTDNIPSYEFDPQINRFIVNLFRESQEPYFLISQSASKPSKMLESILKDQNIKTLLVVPFIIDGKIEYLLGIENVLDNKKWKEEEIKLLQVAIYLYGLFFINNNLRLTLENIKLQFNALLDSFPDVIVVKDNEERWVFANKSAVEYFGLEGVEYRGKTNKELIKYVSKEVARRSLLKGIETNKKLIQQKKPIKYVRKYDLPSKEELYLEIRKVPIYDKHYNFKGLLTIVKDITEDEKLRREMEKSERLKSLGLMAGSIAHDFNNLLTAIMGSASLLEKKIGPELRESVKAILDASYKAKELATQMLSYAGERVIEKDVLNLKEEVMQMKVLLEKVIHDDITLKIEKADEAIYIKANRGQLQQILANLVINASDAIGKREGRIIIKVYKEYLHNEDSPGLIIPSKFIPGEYAVIEIEDTGPGIPEDKVDHLFDPFFSTKETGRGLGLFTVFGIVKAYNGAIKILSEEGRGTIFKIYLPTCPYEEKIKEKRVNQAPKNKRFKILVVDDEEYIREILYEMLSYIGHDVLLSESSQKALEILEKDPSIEIIITDYRMPKMTGLELIEKIRSKRKDLKIILSSGYTEDDLEEIKEEKNLLFLQKPYNMESLKRVIDKLQ